jgi:hypothetical protein
VSHTPTPWAQNKYGEPVGPDGDNIRAKGLALTNSDEAQANTAFIVKAVNSHDALVEALRGARPILLMLIDDEYNVDTWGLKQKLAAIDAALEEAK